MKTMLFIALAVIAISSVSSLTWDESNTHLYTHEHYEVQFGKRYSNFEEHQMRKSIFEENLKKINEINRNPAFTWKAGVNHLTDYTPEELNSIKGYNKDMARSFFGQTPILEEKKKFLVKDTPESKDWRTEGVVNDAKSQGGCGSCWAFGAVATLESHLAIESGQLLDLSEQQLVSCAPNPNNCGGVGGCGGSTAWLGFTYYQTAGVTTQASYPYQGKNSDCDTSKVVPVATVGGWVMLPANDYDSLLNAVGTIGPMAISVCANGWAFYSKGVFNGNCGSDVNHVVTAVGYGEDSELGKYWIVKNSWGKGWGENGYIRIARENSSADVKCSIDKHPEQGSGCKGGPKEITVCGLCGMYMDSSYPTGVKLN